MIDSYGLVKIENNEVLTTSRIIAKTFGKKNYHVSEAIRKMNCSESFNASNYRLVNYTDLKGEVRKEYLVSESGCMKLIMGFKGEKAAVFQEAFIEEFIRMRDFLNGDLKNELRVQSNTHTLELNKMESSYAGWKLQQCKKTVGLIEENNIINESLKLTEFYLKQEKEMWRLENSQTSKNRAEIRELRKGIESSDKLLIAHKSDYSSLSEEYLSLKGCNAKLTKELEILTEASKSYKSDYVRIRDKYCAVKDGNDKLRIELDNFVSKHDQLMSAKNNKIKSLQETCNRYDEMMRVINDHIILCE